MTVHYHKSFKVPHWVLVNSKDSKLINKITEWFQDSGAYIREWPGKDFKEHILSFKNKGWAHVFDKEVIVVAPQLLATAVDTFLAEKVGNRSRINMHLPIHKVDRTVRSDDDYMRMFNDVLLMHGDVELSALFMVGDISHDTNKRNRPVLWVTAIPYDSRIVSCLADDIITIGDGASNTIDISGVSGKKIGEHLTEKFGELIQNGLIKGLGR